MRNKKRLMIPEHISRALSYMSPLGKTRGVML